MSSRITETFKKGYEAERKLAVTLKERYGGQIIMSTRDEDMHDHVDFTWVKNNGIAIKFDVKSQYKHTNAVIDTVWVEQKNVLGDNGWVYGKADFIAYEREYYWVVIARKELATITEAFVKNKVAATSKMDICAPYTREGRNDVVVRIPMSEVMLRGKLLWKADNYIDTLHPKIEYNII